MLFPHYSSLKSLCKWGVVAAFCLSTACLAAEGVERRMAVDVGSGSTKVAIADVDVMAERIVQMVYEDSFPVPYQARLESSYDGSFDEEIRELGMATFHTIAGLKNDFGVEKVAAVATAAFRDASNGKLFAEEVHAETGIPLHVIPQWDEGTLAFQSGIAGTELPAEELIVWDIGTGSFQMTTVKEGKELTIFMGGMGSVPFRNYIIDVIQGKDSDAVHSPNPMTDEEISDADRYARAAGRKAYPIIKDKIKEPNVRIVGIGRLFSHSIGPVGSGATVVRKDLRTYIRNCTGLSDEEMDNPFAHVDVSNAVLVLAFMKALHIQEIDIVDTKTTHGMLIYAPYWKE